MPYPGILRALPHVRPNFRFVETSARFDPAAPVDPALPVAPRFSNIARSWSLGARLLPACLSTALLAGCATLLPDAGLDAVQRIAKDGTGHDVSWSRTDSESEAMLATVRQILQRPLSVDDAVQVALINNRGLQAIYAELGIADADLVRAGWPHNPGFSFSHLQGGGEKEIERSFTLELVGLLTIPLATRLERDRVEATKLSVAAQVLDVAGQTRRAYFRAVAAQQTARYMEQVENAAEAGAELAQRMARAGNWTKLDQAREQSFYADATAQVARSRQTALTEREKLTRLLGLSGAAIQFILPERLPELPAGLADSTDLEARALRDRLDLQASRKEVESLASSLGLTKATRFINVLEVGYRSKSDSGLPLKQGYQISFELPLFDFTGAKVARAEYVYMQAVNRAAEVATNAQSEVRETYAASRTAYDLARHYRDKVVPLRKQISDENQLRYNAMLISVFELLADAREQVMSVNASINALRDFWVAETDLQIAIKGSSTAMGRTATRAAAN
jgi:outer membrane protein TolC